MWVQIPPRDITLSTLMHKLLSLGTLCYSLLYWLRFMYICRDPRDSRCNAVFKKNNKGKERKEDGVVCLKNVIINYFIIIYFYVFNDFISMLSHVKLKTKYKTMIRKKRLSYFYKDNRRGTTWLKGQPFSLSSMILT